MHGVSSGSDWTRLLPGFLLAGLGIGLANPSIGSTALGVVDPRRSGMASGINNTFRLGGVAAGVAVLGAIFQHGITAKLAELLPAAPHKLGTAIASGGSSAASRLPGLSPAAAADAARQAFLAGLNEILLVGAAITLVGAVAAFALVRARDFERHDAPQENPREAVTSAP
jgi:hypothetical protein